jgi:hypothetical protein
MRGPPPVPRHRERSNDRSGFDLTSANRVCDRCEMSFVEGFTWPGLGIPLVLCKECTEDIEDSVQSYGETGERSRVRLLDRLRAIGM